MEDLVPVVCVHTRGVSPIQGAGLEGFHCNMNVTHIGADCSANSVPQKCCTDR